MKRDDTRYQNLLKILRDRSYSVGDQIQLASGRTSDFYFDTKQTTLFPEGARLVGEILYERVRQLPQKIAAVGGMEVSAIPLIDAVIHTSLGKDDPIPGFFVRKVPKKHGLKKMIEGPFPPGSIVVMLEDVVTTGKSALRAVSEVEREGCKVACVIALIDRLEDGRGSIEKAGYDFDAIFTHDDFND